MIYVNKVNSDDLLYVLTFKLFTLLYCIEMLTLALQWHNALKDHQYSRPNNLQLNIIIMISYY